MTIPLIDCITKSFVLMMGALVVSLNASAYTGPLIDGHAHWGNAFVVEAVLERYRSNGVVAQIVMPRYLGVREDPPTTDETVIAIAQSHPGQMFVLAGMQRPDFTYMDWNAPNSAAQKILAEIDQKLAQGKVVGIGEVLVRHWAYAGDGGRIGLHAEINQTLDSVFIRQIAAVAIRHDVPVVIHMEAYPDLVAQLTRVLKELPQLKLVWAHGCGRLNPTKIQELLESHPALYCDLSNMTNTGGYGSGWPRAELFTSKWKRTVDFLSPTKNSSSLFQTDFLWAWMWLIKVDGRCKGATLLKSVCSEPGSCWGSCQLSLQENLLLKMPCNSSKSSRNLMCHPFADAS